MKRFLVIVGIVAIAGVAVAQEKSPDVHVSSLGRVPCNLIYVAHDWDFSVSDHGFTTTTCDTEGAPVWAHGAYGAEVDSDPPTGPQDVWGTVLGANYPINAGEGLVSPAFEVTPSSDTMEVLHYVAMETSWDGGNVSVDGTVVPPISGYPDVLNEYPWCVHDEEAFSDYDNPWEEVCFDLSAFVGQTIQVEFDFGSDSSVTYPGWYLAYVKIGDPEIPVELQSITVE